MRKTIEATWREGFLHTNALVAPKVNNLYTRKSQHIAERIQRMLRINQLAILIGAPIAWVMLSAVGLPYTGAIMWAAWTGLVVIRHLSIAKFAAPDTSLDSYQYLKAFQGWLKGRMARSRRMQRHLYAVTFLAIAVGMGASAGGQQWIRSIIESLVNGVPVVLIAGVVAVAIVLELFGGAIFDFDVNIVYREVFRKLDEMVAEMEELRS